MDSEAKRLRGLRRLVALQAQLQRLAEADLAQAMRDRDAVRASIDGLLQAMGGLSDTHRLFPHLYAKQLARLKARDQVLAGQIERHRARINAEKKRGERVGERLGRASQALERQDQEEGLFDLLDQVTTARR